MLDSTYFWQQIMECEIRDLQDLLNSPNNIDEEWASYVNEDSKAIHQWIAGMPQNDDSYLYLRKNVFPLIRRARTALNEITDQYSRAMRMRLRVIAMYSKGVKGDRNFKPFPPISREEVQRRIDSGELDPLAISLVGDY